LIIFRGGADERDPCPDPFLVDEGGAAFILFPTSPGAKFAADQAS